MQQDARRAVKDQVAAAAHSSGTGGGANVEAGDQPKLPWAERGADQKEAQPGAAPSQRTDSGSANAAKPDDGGSEGEAPDNGTGGGSDAPASAGMSVQ